MGLKRRQPNARPTSAETSPEPRKPSSPRRAQASRDNGKKGGRPRKVRDFSDFADVPEPPVHPLELGSWLQRIISIEADRAEAGRADKEMTKALRAYARAMSLIMPAAIMVAALEPEGGWRDALDGPMPTDPFAVAHRLLWRQAQGVARVIRGEPDPQGAEVRGLAITYAKVIPPDALYMARRKLERDHQELGGDDGPDTVPARPPAPSSAAGPVTKGASAWRR